MRKVPYKNYLILFGLIVLIICGCFATYNLYSIYKETNMTSSPLANKEVLYDDLKNILLDFDADTLLVISHTEDQKILNNEESIKKVLSKKNLIDNVLYLNVTELKNDENFLDNLNNTLGLKKDKRITKFPAIIYYQQKKPTYVIDSKDELLNENNVLKLIDLYNLASE